MASADARCALYHHAPGSTAAMSVYQTGDWRHSRTVLAPKLVGSDARAAYVINKTPAAECHDRIAAIADTEFLAEILARETRSAAVTAVLAHPLLPLDAVVMLRTRPWRWRGSPSSYDFHQALLAAAVRHTDAHGEEATLEFLDSLVPRLTIGELSEVIAVLPRTYTDPEFIAALLERPDRVLEYLDSDCFIECTLEVVRVLATSRDLARHIAEIPELLDRDPLLVDLLYESCVTHTDRPARIVAESLASRALGAARLERLATMHWDGSTAAPGCGEPAILAQLACNPACPASVLAGQPVGGRPGDRGHVAGRLLAERFGDDAQAFALAAELLDEFTGTYDELCRLVTATLA